MDAPASPLPLLALLATLGTLLWLWWPLRRAARRDAVLRARPLPDAWAQIVARNVPLALQLPPALRARLHGHLQVFLADKAFVGCDGLAIDDEHRVTIAAQACLLLLGQPGGACFPRLRQVLVYPAAFVVPRRRLLPGGVVDERPQALAGESWVQGQVILAWSEVQAGAADAADGRNVVLHEFAHQIDQDSGVADGRPWRRSAAARQRWADVMDAALTRLRDAPSPLLDGYGASDPAEYFAVATEAFFERPHELADEAPEVYRELALLYRLDPRVWRAPRPRPLSGPPGVDAVPA